jgi:hypothetical protein
MLLHNWRQDWNDRSLSLANLALTRTAGPEHNEAPKRRHVGSLGDRASRFIAFQCQARAQICPGWRFKLQLFLNFNVT